MVSVCMFSCLLEVTVHDAGLMQPNESKFHVNIFFVSVLRLEPGSLFYKTIILAPMPQPEKIKGSSEVFQLHMSYLTNRVTNLTFVLNLKSYVMNSSRKWRCSGRHGRTPSIGKINKHNQAIDPTSRGIYFLIRPVYGTPWILQPIWNQNGPYTVKKITDKNRLFPAIHTANWADFGTKTARMIGKKNGNYRWLVKR